MVRGEQAKRAECVVRTPTHEPKQRNVLQVMGGKGIGDESRHQAQVLGLGVALVSGRASQERGANMSTLVLAQNTTKL